MWHGSRTLRRGRSRHMFRSRGAHNGTIITAKRGASRRRLDGGKVKRQQNAHRDDQRKENRRRPLRGHSASRQQRNDAGGATKGLQLRAQIPQKIPPITAINDGTVDSCRRTRSVRTLGGTKEGVAPRLSHTGLMIAPPPPRCQMIEGLATETHSKQHVRGAQHVLRTRRSPLRVQADRSSQRVVMMSSPPSCRSHRSQKSAQQRTSSLASPTRRSRHLLTPPLISRSPQQSSFPWCIAITGNVRSFSCL